MKTFRSSLREHAGNVISFENKEMLQLSKKLLKLHDDAKTCYICEKKYAKDESYWKVTDYKTCSVPMKKNRKVEKDGNDDVITIPYKIKLFDSARFMASSFHKILSTISQKKKKKS